MPIMPEETDIIEAFGFTDLYGAALSSKSLSAKEKAAIIKAQLEVMKEPLVEIIGVSLGNTWERIRTSPMSLIGFSGDIRALAVEDILAALLAQNNRDFANAENSIAFRDQIANTYTVEEGIAVRTELDRLIPHRLAKLIKDTSARKTVKGNVRYAMQQRKKPFEKRLADKKERIANFPNKEIAHIFHAAASKAKPVNIMTFFKFAGNGMTQEMVAKIIPDALDFCSEVLTAIVEGSPKMAIDALKKQNDKADGLGFILQKLEDSLFEADLLPDFDAIAKAINQSRKKKPAAPASKPA